MDMNNEASQPMLLRNYKPQTQFLADSYIVQQAEPGSIKHLISDKLELVSDDYKIDPKGIEAKKVDWDLKRRIEKKLDKLERETRRCIDRSIATKKKQ